MGQSGGWMKEFRKVGAEGTGRAGLWLATLMEVGNSEEH